MTPVFVALLWRLASRSWPAAVRAECGAEMEETFSLGYEAARRRGPGSAVRFLAREIAAVVRHGFAERLGGSRNPAGAGRPPLLAAQDVRYAFRLLARTPLFTAMTILVLAGGLGISVFTFAFLRTAVSAPIPVADGDRVVRLNQELPNHGFASLDAAEFARVRGDLRSLAETGAYRDRSTTVGTAEGAWLLDVTATEWNLFATTRARPLLGRTLGAGDGAPGAEPVVVLGHRTWRAAFGSDSALVGRVVELGGVPTRVVGIMPPGFEFPVATEAWVPIDPALVDPPAGRAGAVDVFGRLADGASSRSAEAELAVLIARDRAAHPLPPGDEPRLGRVVVRSYPLAQVGDEGPWMVAGLNGLAALILLLACINVGNLLLARAHERGREMVVRQALGASRGRLVMQHLWESIILCVAGGVAATGLAVAGLELVDGWARAHLDGNLAFWWRWGFDRSVLFAAGGFVTVAVAALGGVVAVRATRGRFVETLRSGSAPTEGRQGARWSSALVVTQIVAVTLVMFVGVVAAIGARRILTVEIGHDTSRLLRTGFGLPADRYPTMADVSGFRQGLTATLLSRAEVENVLFRADLAAITGDEGRLEVAGRPAAPGEEPRAYVAAVSGSLATLGVPIAEGRALGAGDDAGAAPVVMVSRALAADPALAGGRGGRPRAQAARARGRRRAVADRGRRRGGRPVRQSVLPEPECAGRVPAPRADGGRGSNSWSSTGIPKGRRRSRDRGREPGGSGHCAAVPADLSRDAREIRALMTRATAPVFDGLSVRPAAGGERDLWLGGPVDWRRTRETRDSPGARRLGRRHSPATRLAGRPAPRLRRGGGAAAHGGRRGGRLAGLPIRSSITLTAAVFVSAASPRSCSWRRGFPPGGRSGSSRGTHCGGTAEDPRAAGAGGRKPACENSSPGWSRPPLTDHTTAKGWAAAGAPRSMAAASPRAPAVRQAPLTASQSPRRRRFGLPMAAKPGIRPNRWM
ncbi:MAG: ABC transporter permease [Gemmatimonadales bacterium]